jgi:Leucine-rich repeat (LRR) protein
VGDIGLSALTQCHQLRSLDVQKCEITDVGVTAILSTLLLTELDISYCNQVVFVVGWF